MSKGAEIFPKAQQGEGSKQNLIEQAQQIQENVDGLIDRINTIKSVIRSHESLLQQQNQLSYIEIQVLLIYGDMVLGFLEILRKNIKNNSFNGERMISAQLHVLKDWENDLTEKTLDWLCEMESKLIKLNIDIRQQEE
jgi:hypothetical protein